MKNFKKNVLYSIISILLGAVLIISASFWIWWGVELLMNAWYSGNYFYVIGVVISTLALSALDFIRKIYFIKANSDF